MDHDAEENDRMGAFSKRKEEHPSRQFWSGSGSVLVISDLDQFVCQFCRIRLALTMLHRHLPNCRKLKEKEEIILQEKSKVADQFNEQHARSHGNVSVILN
jgi:hypothetical protein